MPAEMIKTTLLLSSLLVLCACAQSERPAVARMNVTERLSSVSAPPPDARGDSCWGVEETPAVIEETVQSIVLQPAQMTADGTVLSPPVTKQEVQQKIIRERKETWFETLCEDELTPDFIASLQRALIARGLFDGEIDGTMTSQLGFSIRRYQGPQGLDSSILSRAAARQMGLVLYKPTAVAEG